MVLVRSNTYSNTIIKQLYTLFSSHLFVHIIVHERVSKIDCLQNISQLQEAILNAFTIEPVNSTSS